MRGKLFCQLFIHKNAFWLSTNIDIWENINKQVCCIKTIIFIDIYAYIKCGKIVDLINKIIKFLSKNLTFHFTNYTSF